jgi:hypothetical protein
MKWVKVVWVVYMMSCIAKENKIENSNALNLSDWKIIYTAIGDLGCDGKEEVVYVMQSKESRVYSNEPDFKIYDRKLVILPLDTTHEVKQAIYINNDIIRIHEDSNMQDPFQTIEIKDGEIIVTHFIFHLAGSWWMSTIKNTYVWEDYKLKQTIKEETAINRAGGELIYEYKNLTTGFRYQMKDNFYDEMESK